ncbi:MAG: DoxX family protein [Bacteroidales bacterium]|nr:DoxX family protein [Bacteroidales bacterium]
MNRFYFRLRRGAAILTGIVFLVSGLLKLMDPVGTMLIVTEYCKFLHLQFLLPAAKVLGINLALTESALGVALITGVVRKFAAWVTFVMLGFFTLLTLVLWIRNPEMDCGCFGEAFHLTHAQSFWKNVILLALSLFAFLPMRSLGHAKKRKRLAAMVGWASLVAAAVYCNLHIPPLDFTPFAPGAELFASLDNDYQATDGYRAAFVYEKDGQQGTFTLDNLPDSTWTFVKVDSLYRETPGKGPEKPILSFRDASGEYQDELAVLDKVVVFSVYAPAKARWERLSEQVRQVEEAGARPLLLVTGTPEDVPAGLNPYFADYKTLITLNRSNGGISYFDKGELIAKWGRRDFPKDIKSSLADDPVDLATHLSVRKSIQVQGFCLYLGAILILL